jgi:hypothetical protein
MSRHPVKALEKADPIARQRGDVQYYERGPGMNADFTITIPAIFAPVKIKRMRYLRCTVRWLEREAAEEIAGLRLYPSSREISRELWFCSSEYAFRFFRVCDTGLVELGRDGLPLPEKSPVPKPGVPAAPGFGRVSIPVSPGNSLANPCCQAPRSRSPSENTFLKGCPPCQEPHL